MKMVMAFTLLLSALASCAHGPTPHAAASGVDSAGDLPVRWNQVLLMIAEEEDGFMTLKGVRTAAMMHAAMHDALNSIESRYATYLPTEMHPSADPVVAAAAAAHAVVVAEYPDRRANLDEELAHAIAPRTGPSAEEGHALGQRIARAILEHREGDLWDGEAEYMWHPMGPGVYAEFGEHSGTPEGFVFGAGWANVRPFLLESGDQFRSPPPPEISSDEYTRAYREVQDVGRFDSRTRTADQTHLALWWKDFVESSHNRLARKLALEEELDLWRSARVFTLLNMSVFDAYINVFDNKFFYNHWRPYTAIRWAEHDGNPDTEPEADWTNTHQHTYAFPSYPSAHGCASAAAMEALRDTFGGGRSFRMDTRWVDRAGPFSGKIEMDPPFRSFDGFREAALECSLSRIYLGIHFRYDSVEGNLLGSRIGQYAVEHSLVPVP